MRTGAAVGAGFSVLGEGDLDAFGPVPTTLHGASAAAGFTKNYAFACFPSAGTVKEPAAPMTMFVADTGESASPMRGLLPLWVGIGIFVLYVLSGDQLLKDPDTYWQIELGRSILEQKAVPRTDIYSFTMYGQPWISTQWLAQALLAVSYSIAGWTGPVVLGAASIAVTFGLLVRFLVRRLSDGASMAFTGAAVALAAVHLVARPHVLALPIMVTWVGALLAAIDRRTAPSFWLLPLMALWANLHGGFVLGLALIAPMALDAVGRGCPVTQIAGAALGLVRRRGARRKLPYALRLGHAVRGGADYQSRRRAGFDRRVASGQLRSSGIAGSRCYAGAGFGAVARRASAAGSSRAFGGICADGA
ncbi:MAG: hypothetical protein QOC84_2255 [Bradyrhizobium sp.]|nr:hypothetical protein [Bradyrhizobium sp.]